MEQELEEKMELRFPFFKMEEITVCLCADGKDPVKKGK